jgi:anti-sigma factor RsiW
MDTCIDTTPLVTAWVDGDLDPAAASRVAAHVAVCERCAAAAEGERAVRRLLHDRREALTATRAPETLVARLRALDRPVAAAPVRRAWLRLPVAVAATLFLALSGFGLHVATGRSTTVLAAQLVADHKKCHLTEHVEHGLQPQAARNRLAIRYGFHAAVPPGTPDGRLELVGARRCLTGEGTNAHILYRLDGRPLSLYMLPKEGRAEQSVDMFGERAHVWSRHNGTYVLVGDASAEGLSEIAAYMQQATR